MSDETARIRRQHQLLPQTPEQDDLVLGAGAEVDRAVSLYHRRRASGQWLRFLDLAPASVRAALEEAA